jgi:hypothetical protein
LLGRGVGGGDDDFERRGNACDVAGERASATLAGAGTVFLGDISILILASWMILLVHLIEGIVRAGFFKWKGCFANNSAATIFP